MTAWLIRHAQSTSNAGLPATDYGQMPLTELGRKQAAELSQVFDRSPDLVVFSPFLRAQQTADPLINRWPDISCEVWPIQEFTYLSPSRCLGSTVESRRLWTANYWEKSDPRLRTGPGAECFGEFVSRLTDFHEQLLKHRDGFVVVFGHGQFFCAYLLGLQVGFAADSAWMSRFREFETNNPIGNTERIVLEVGHPPRRIASLR